MGPVSDDVFKNLASLVNGRDADTYHANDQLVFLRGIVAIDNSRLFTKGAVAKQFIKRPTVSDLYEDIYQAFKQPNVVGLSSHSVVELERQIDLMDRITKAAGEHAGIMMMLGVMKARLGGHYYHGLRAGIMFCSLLEVFDPDNKLPLRTKLLAGIIHDLGKLKVPRDILFKSDKLTAEENAIMMAHDVYTEYGLMPFDPRFPYLSKVAANHHFTSKVSTSDNPHAERAGLLMRIGDIYDALGSERDYKKAWPENKVECVMLSKKYFPNHPEEVWYLLDSFPCPIKGWGDPSQSG